GEYRKPKRNEWYLNPHDRSGDWGKGTVNRSSDPYSLGSRLILREKPLAYEDFVAIAVHGTIVRLDDDGYIRVGSQWHTITEVPDLIGAIKAAADHVDRVNAQKDAAS
ncbi:hypothetical protein, partial [Campylobacter jejuni]|uniref:hypothetical protein n=1 Tax=Campylobacter jejuni TaxID=197 RepID=UPI001AD6BD3E